MPKIIIVQDLDKKQFRDEYQNTIGTLLQIENTASPTNAQIVAAVKFLAKTVRVLLKVIVKFMI